MRLARFCTVGAMGVAVQLAVLALLNRLWPGHYLWATALAMEVTLLHNFWWHVRYTWRDRARSHKGSRLHQLLRFQMANGLISLAGNLLLMRLLVHGAHLSVVLANACAITACAAFNFAIGEVWVFRKPAHERALVRCRHPRRRRQQPGDRPLASMNPVD